MALILGLCVSVAQTAFGLMAPATPVYMRAVKYAAAAFCVMMLVSFCSLLYVFGTSDFSVLLVALHSHSLKPFLYKIAAAWGNHEGSMLLWMLVLSVFGALLAFLPARYAPRADTVQRALGVQGLLGLGFAAFTLLTSSPFIRVQDAPFDGNGLNPVLQDPGLAFHPPTLYLGYVGFSSVFSLAAGGLLTGHIDTAWARFARIPATLAWTALSAGIAGGAWWAFYELGWGGWWFWDPVENASLLPWLAGTALLHSLAVLEVRGALKRWTVFLSIITFCLSLLGTFLVRSGVLTSVHAFATDPSRGLFILGMLAFYALFAFGLYAWRAHSLRVLKLFAPLSREGTLVANNLLLVTMTATVLLGTLYPIVSDMTGGGQISVGPPYFNAVMLPLALPLFVLMAFSPFLPWKRAGRFTAWRTIAACLPVTLGVFAYVLADHTQDTLALISAFLGLFAAATTLAYAAHVRGHLNLRKLALVLGHMGLGLAMIGALGSTLWRVEDLRLLRQNESYDIAGWHLTFQGTKTVYGENYAAEQATLIAARDGATLTLHPEKRWYPVAEQTTSEAAIHVRALDDLYVVLGDARDGGYIIRTYVHPFITGLWGGFGLVILSGVFALLASLKQRERTV